MKRINMGLILTLAAGILLMASCSNQEPQLGKSRSKKVIKAMTREEKALYVTGAGMRRPNAAQTDTASEGPVLGVTENGVPGAAGTTYEIPRLGITSMVVTDGPAGVRISPTREGDSATYYCTAFPVATLLASTWDTDLVNRVGQAMGNEVLEYGADILLGPALNIHRNPLCGRNFEYYSEDPYVAGKMAAAMVNGIQSEGVGTSIKHFDANNAETNRNSLNTIVSERALREIYLEGFRIAVQESQPWTVMSSYNLINGTYAPESYDLLTKVLRDDWGFQGYVMTDWGGGRDAVAMMEAGNNLLMPGSPQQAETILQAMQDSTLDESVVDRNIEGMLNIVEKTPRFKGYSFSNKPDLQAHAEVTRQAATEGMVLLKNDNEALPLEDVSNLAVFGNTSYNIITGGTGSGDVNEAYSVPLPEGLENVGYTVNEDLQAVYDTYISEQRAIQAAARAQGAQGGPGGMGGGMFGRQAPIAEMPVNATLANRMAGSADHALITIGRNSGEGRDRTNEEGDFLLNTTEKEMIRTVCDAFHAQGKKVIVVLNIGGVIETASWRELPDAILLAWQGGQETGNSIADILSGRVNPSGKLASTFPMQYQDVPSSGNFPGTVIETETEESPAQQGGFFGRGRDAKVVYEEGIYVGYRYYETFGVEPAYEFGYGMSYTTFEYSNLTLSAESFDGPLTVTVDVTNMGEVAGKEVVQLYLSAPANKLDKPEEELKGFAKTGLLQPGEKQTLTFTLTDRSLASFDTPTSTWVAEAGTYTVKIGASSKDIRQSATFTLADELQVKKVSTALVPPERIAELKP